jgi:excisionase family DNA binding protein
VKDPKAEVQHPNGEPLKAETGAVQELVTSRGVAVALGVSLRTVERMIHDEEIKPVRLRGWLVRFRLEDVMEAVRNQGRKWGRAADAEKLKAEIQRRQGA